MADSTLHIRIPAKLKKAVQKVAEANGMDLSSAIRLFFMHVALRGTMPLPWITVNGFTPEFEEKLVKQIRKPKIAATLKSDKDIDSFIDGL